MSLSREVLTDVRIIPLFYPTIKTQRVNSCPLTVNIVLSEQSRVPFLQQKHIFSGSESEDIFEVMLSKLKVLDISSIVTIIDILLIQVFAISIYIIP